MTKTFGELRNGELFMVYNAKDIVFNRGDRTEMHVYRGTNGFRLVFQKRDEFGGHILYRSYGYNDVVSSVYYRIEPNNPVNVDPCVI
jgi:hypothetical protein